MPSSGSKSRSPHRNRRKSNSPDKGRPSKDKRSPSSSSRSSHSSRSRQRSAERGSRSHNNDKSKEYTRYPPRREIEPVQQNPKLFVTNIDSKVPPFQCSILRKNSTERSGQSSNPSENSRKSLSRPNKAATTRMSSSSMIISRPPSRHSNSKNGLR